MTPTQWQRLQELVSAALDLPQAERDEFLHDVCGSNVDLQRQVEGLLLSYEQAGSFIEEAVGASAYAAFRTDSPAEGDRIGAYQISGVIGHGGMGTVYCASRSDDQFRQQVAIKVLSGGLGTTPELLRRFRAERQILASLTHPNIARLLDGGVTTSGLPYLVMEFIEGTTIERFAENRNLNVRDRLALFRQVCGAIQYAHQNLIVHRDLKPANVMVTQDGTPKLLDFGIAKLLGPDTLGQTVALTKTSDRLMTPEYASPEQIRGEPITTATDVYGLGVLLYELLTGKRPFRAANLSAAGLERLICETPPERPSTARAGGGTLALERIPGELDNIVLKAMHKDPARRYASAAELSEDLRLYLDGFPISARADSWQYRTRKFVSRHRIATAASALFAITTTALSVGLAIQVTRAKRELRTSNEESKFLGSLFEGSRPDETQGRSTSARDLLDRGADRVAKELAGEPLVEARLLNTLGSVYYTLGANERAQSLLNRAYEIRVRLLGSDSEEAGESLQTLAWIASDRGQYDQAGKDFETLLRIYTRNKGRNSAEVAEILNDSGLLRWTTGDFAGATEREREAIAAWSQIGGPTNVHTLTAKNNLEIVLADEGDYGAAESLAREILATRLRVLGPNHPGVAVSFNNLAIVLGRTGRFSEAERAARESLDLRRKLQGREHPEVASSLLCLTWLARILGRYDESQKLGEEALAMSTNLQGKNSASTAAAEDQLGLTMLAKGDFQRARELLEASLAIRSTFPNPVHPQLAASYEHVGLADLAMKNVGDARRSIERALEMRVRFYGRDNDNVAVSLNDLGQVLTVEGDYADAEQKYREAIKIARAKFKGPHTITADGLLGLGSVLMAEGRLAEAETPLMESLAMRQKLLPAKHPDIVESEEQLAKCENLASRQQTSLRARSRL